MKFKKAHSIAVIALVFIATAFTLVTSAVLLNQQKVPAQDEVGSNVSSSKNIGVYVNEAATTGCSNVDWGNLCPGGSTSQILYIKNTGNIKETLNMTTSDWNPISANSVLILTWDKENTTLSPGTVIPATLELTAASETGSLTAFNFAIQISGNP